MSMFQDKNVPIPNGKIRPPGVALTFVTIITYQTGNLDLNWPFLTVHRTLQHLYHIFANLHTYSCHQSSLIHICYGFADILLSKKMIETQIFCQSSTLHNYYKYVCPTQTGTIMKYITQGQSGAAYWFKKVGRIPTTYLDNMKWKRRL